MDSGNSGSLQSSSGGGDEEYDSRAESISSFLNPTAHVGLIPNPPPPQPPHHHHHHHTSTTPMFDPLLQNYFEPISRPHPNLSNPSSSLLNLDMVWFKPQRSDPNCTQINPILTSSSSCSVQPFFGSQQTQQSVEQPPPPPASSSDHQQVQTHVVRNPKKRPRASRRAPTTVLTTDTANFRAMVQEFTGIPAPPFTSSSPFSRTRLDIGRIGNDSYSFLRSNTLDNNNNYNSQPPYLLRPFPQKVVQPPQPPPPPPPQPPFVSFTSTSTNNITPNVNYQLPSQSDFLNIQNPILPFQSLLQFPPKYPLASSAVLGSNDSHLKMGVLDQFGFNQHGHGARNLVPAEGTASRNNDNNPTSLRSVDGNYDYLRNVSNGKLNFSASSSDFRGDKGSENVATRGEGMVESWICSSD